MGMAAGIRGGGSAPRGLQHLAQDAFQAARSRALVEGRKERLQSEALKGSVCLKEARPERLRRDLLAPEDAAEEEDQKERRPQDHAVPSPRPVLDPIGEGPIVESLDHYLVQADGDRRGQVRGAEGNPNPPCNVDGV